MRRGGVLILLIGLIVVVGGVMAFMVLSGTGGGSSSTVATALPTEVPLVDIVRARVDIKANTVITDSAQLALAKIPQPEFDTAKDFSKIADVQGQLATRDIVAGDPIGQSDLVEPGLSQQIPTAESPRPRDKAYPFIVNNLSGVSDQMKPGDFVDIVATFTISRRTSFPTGFTPEQQGQAPMLQREISESSYSSTKTIVQRAQVLKIMRPPVAPAVDVTPAPNASPGMPQIDGSGKVINPASSDSGAAGTMPQGEWTILLAVNDQEVELIEFSLATNSRMVLVLRGAGDNTFEPSIGATFDLLVSEFGIPLPQLQPPNVIGPNQVFTPEPTRTAAPVRVP